jgi:tetratricopeptide (TPR) repeat protein
MSISYPSAQLRLQGQSNPGSGFARLAEALRLEGRLEDAILVCRQGMALYPSQVSGYLVLGKCLLASGLKQEARLQFEAVLRLDSRCPAALQFLARLAAESQGRDAAIGYYQSILDMDPWDKEAEAYLTGTVDSPASREFGLDLDAQLDALFALGGDEAPLEPSRVADPVSIETQLDLLFLDEAPPVAPDSGVTAPLALSKQISDDDDDGYPEEDEEDGDGSRSAVANVATVTLAEIYFQQGLKEHALQIYRRLLEREPGNQSVGKRIQEIVASKVEDGGIRSLGEFHRPRPGLKVPKRKV